MTQDEEWLLQEKYNGEKTEGFFADCIRLAANEPLGYIIGSVPFLHSTIHLDSKPLIPRTETEFWVEKIIHQMKTKAKQELRVLDLCAGSGAIGVAVLSEIASAQVDFVEIDPLHHPTIQKNIIENEIDLTRTNILGGNLFEKITTQYDYILTNPPYIDPVLDRTTESVQQFEPKLALYGGTAGTELISNIITQASQFLTNSGTLVIEHEPEQTDAIHTHAKSHDFTYATFTDQYELERYTQLTKIGHSS